MGRPLRPVVAGRRGCSVVSTALDELQARLETHFGALAEARTERKLPVFALEHGLSSDELAAMTGELKTKLSAAAAYQLRKHWLVWIVYATEQGYDYEGDEYWHTFERRMPRWDRAWRPALRSWFGKFQEKYRGLRPVGAWANFFSIIAWPITHSLLPKDLQGQLARTLYSLRYNLVSRLDRPPAEIGRYIASMSYGGSSRYENFLQQEELVGHIVLALLEHRSADGDAAIHPGTLERLVQDLEKARAAKAWLRDTRQAVEAAKFRGAGRSPSFSERESSRREEPRENRPAIRPSLLLRRMNPDEWTPILEIPSFQQVATLSPHLGEFLSRTRCEVAGSAGYRPPGWLLSGPQRRVISAWPDPRTPVVSFQVPDPTMQHLLASECCIRPGPSWLFRVGSDGQALEIASRLVRPGRSYVLVDAGNPRECAMTSPVAIQCQGVTARQIDIPASLTQAQIDELRSLGLSVGETIRIWPAGLSARGWDGEGTTEWLEGESPCFGIDHDHPVSAYEFRLGNGPALTVSAKPPGEPTFIRLEPLPAGNHVLTVSVARASGEAATRPAEGLVSLSVRPPTGWVPGSVGHAGLIATTEPHEPTLDGFWEGLTDLTILGPTGRRVSVSVELLNGSGGRLAFESVAGIDLPMSSDTWRNAQSAFVRRDKDPWAHLGAAAGRLVIDGDELGAISIPLRRDVAPIRWVWHASDRKRLLRLVDDYDVDTPLAVTFQPFVEPLRMQTIETGLALTGIEPTAPGGLLVASHGDLREAVVVSMPKVEGGLAGLVPDCRIETSERTEGLAFAIAKAVVSWSDARLTGALAGDRRRRVLTRLMDCLFLVICGPKWSAAEQLLERGFRDGATAAMIDCFDRPHRPFAIVLGRDAARYRRMPAHVRAREFACLAQRYAVAPGRLSQPAIELIHVLDGVEQASDDQLKQLIGHVWNAPQLAAGARMIQILGSTR